MSRRCGKGERKLEQPVPGRDGKLMAWTYPLIGFIFLLVAGHEACALTLYVAPSGDNTLQGSREKPLASLDEALLRLRGKTGDREIVLLPGTHLVRKSVLLGAQDSGLPGRPLRIRGEGGNVSLSGYLSLPAAGWSKVTDARDLKRVVDPRVGERLMRFRFHDVDRPKLGGLSRRGIAAGGKAKSKGPPAMLYLGEKRMCLARWPNTGTLSASPGSGQVPAATFNADKGATGSKGGNLLIGSRRPGGWEDSLDIWVNGSIGRGGEWGLTRVEGMSEDGNEIKIYPAGVGSPSAGWKSPPAFFFENVFEELDEANEYFIDVARGLLFFLPPPNDADWASATRLSWSEEPILTIEGARYIELSGFRVEGTRADGIVVKEGLNVLLEDLTVRQCGGDGVVLAGRDIRVKGLVAEDIGGRGMVLQGGDPVSLKASGNMVVNSRFITTGWWNPTWHPAIELAGVGHQVSDCIFSDLPHMAVEFKGNDFLIERCWFHRTCRQPRGMGAIHARLGNYPHMRGTVIRGNLFQDIGRGEQESGTAICLADGTMGVRIYDNVFHRVGSGKESRAIFIDGGSHVIVENNTFIDCPVPFRLQFTPSVNGSSGRMAAWRILLTSESTRKHLLRYRQLADFFGEDREFPDTNSFTGNRIANGRVQLLADKGYLVSGGPEEKLNAPGNVLSGALRGISFDAGGRPIIPGRRPWRPVTASNH